jgi:hypothetical protein
MKSMGEDRAYVVGVVVVVFVTVAGGAWWMLRDFDLLGRKAADTPKVAVRFWAESQAVAAGEPVWVVVEFANLSDVEITFRTPFEVRGVAGAVIEQRHPVTDYFRIERWNAETDEYEPVRLMGMNICVDVPAPSITLIPGEVFHMRVNAASNAVMSAPGRYCISIPEVLVSLDNDQYMIFNAGIMGTSVIVDVLTEID